MGLVHQFADGRRPDRVVVIGAGGVIGRALIAHLRAQRTDVAPLTRSELDLERPDAAGRLAALLRPSDSVVMLSALTPRHGRSPGIMLANVRMAEQVCAALIASPVAHLVYISSDIVYPRRIEIVTEESLVEVAEGYGAMHLIREIMFGNAAGPAVAILRPTQVCAADDTHLAYGPNRFLHEACHQGTITIFGEGEELRDHILVEDVAAIIGLTLRHGSRGSLNVATGRSLPFAEVAEMCRRLVPPNPRIVKAPRAIPITHRRFDTAALAAAFPEFRCHDLEEGLRRVAAKWAAQPPQRS